MRKWNRDRCAGQVLETMGDTDLLIQRPCAEKPLDRHPAHRDDDLRCNHLDLGLEPACAVGDLRWRWHTVSAAARTRPRKAAGDGGDVDPASRDCLIDADLREPSRSEERR